MKRLLCILCIFCLILGTALPAAAEGQLYAKVGDDTCSTGLKIPEGFSRINVRFYSDEAGETPLPAEITPASSDANLIIEADPDHSGAYILTAKKVPETNPVSITAGELGSVSVEILSSRLVTSSGADSISGLDIDDEITTSFRLVSGEESIPYTITAADIPAGGGLEITGGKLYVRKGGEFALGQYTGKVSIQVNYPPVDTSTLIDSKSLNEVLESKDALKDFLGHDVSGTVTIQLPANGKYEETITVGSGLGGVTLVLKGKNTFENGLVVNSGNVNVESITFDGETGITLTADGGSCVVSNCTFNSTKQAICFDVSNSYNVPTLSLSGNTFKSAKALLKENGTEVGTWSFTQGKTGAATVNLGVQVIPGTESTIIRFSEGTEAAAENGWGFKFSTLCNYSDAYFVYGGMLFIDTSFPTSLSLDKDASTLSLTDPLFGVYTCVNDKAPVLEETNDSTRTLKISASQNKYVNNVEMKCPFKAATVNGGKVYSSLDSKGILYFPVDASGTYTIKEVTLPAEQTKVATRTYTISTKDVYPIYHPNFMNTLRLTRDGNVKINCTEAGRRPISIPVESLEAAGAKGMTVTLKAKNYSLLLDTAAVKSLAQQAKGDRVVLQYRSLNHKTLSTVGLASVNSHLEQHPGHVADLAFLVNATSDNESIVDLQMGTVALTVPFIVLPGTEDYPNESFALMTETETEARKTEVKDGYLTTILTDLTEHMVFLEKPVEETVPETTEATEPETVATEAPTEAPTSEPTTLPTEPEQPEESKGFPLWIPIVIVLLAGGGAAAWFLFLRKRLKK